LAHRLAGDVVDDSGGLDRQTVQQGVATGFVSKAGDPDRLPQPRVVGRQHQGLGSQPGSTHDGDVVRGADADLLPRSDDRCRGGIDDVQRSQALDDMPVGQDLAWRDGDAGSFVQTEVTPEADQGDGPSLQAAVHVGFGDRRLVRLGRRRRRRGEKKGAKNDGREQRSRRPPPHAHS
jgi:hypothetical protein